MVRALFLPRGGHFPQNQESSRAGALLPSVGCRWQCGCGCPRCACGCLLPAPGRHCGGRQELARLSRSGFGQGRRCRHPPSPAEDGPQPASPASGRGVPHSAGAGCEEGFQAPTIEGSCRGVFRCTSCFGQNRAKGILRWLRSECHGRGKGHKAGGVHGSHRIFLVGDTVICRRCGLWGCEKLVGLKRPCSGVVPANRVTVLAKAAKGICPGGGGTRALLVGALP